MVKVLLQALLGMAGPILRLILSVLTDKKLFDKAVELATVEVDRLSGDISLDNDTKRKAAAEAVNLALKATGLELKGHLVNLAVEFAVAAAKAALEAQKK